VRASAYIRDNQRIERIGQLLAKALVLSSCAPSDPIVAQSESRVRNADPILMLFEQHKDLGMSEVMNLSGMSRTTAHRHLRALVTGGELIAQGKGRATRYHLPDPPKTQKA